MLEFIFLSFVPVDRIPENTVIRQPNSIEFQVENRQLRDTLFPQKQLCSQVPIRNPHCLRAPPS